jgi:hypothetical protein
MKCSSCGAELAPEDRFCGECGAPRPPVPPPLVEAERPAAQPPPPPFTPAPVPEAPPTRKRSRRKWLAVGCVGLLAAICMLAGAGLVWGRSDSLGGITIDLGPTTIRLGGSGTAPVATRAPAEVPTRPQTATPMPETPGTLYTSPSLGFSMSYPVDWVYKEEQDGAMFGTSEEILGAADWEDGAGMFIAGGEDLKVETAAQLVGLLSALIGSTSEIGMSDPQPRTIGGQVGVIATFEGTAPDTQIRVKGFAAATEYEGWGYFFLALSVLDDWPEYGPDLEEMLGSVRFIAGTRPTSAPSPSAEGVIEFFSCSFEDLDCGWDTYSDESGEVYAIGHELFLVAKGPYGLVEAEIPGVQVQDFYLYFVAELRSELGVGDYGAAIRCDPANDGTFYEFELSSNGEYRVWEWVDYEPTLLDSGIAELDPSGENSVSIFAQGPRLTFLVNTEFLTEVMDAELREGPIRLLAGVVEEADVEVAVSHVIVQAP